MKVFLRRKKSGIDAIGDYNPENKTLTVKKGSVVSGIIKYSATFKGTDTIEKYRKEYVEDGKVKKDVTFTSASTAANFVTGGSTNGLKAWKNENDISLKDIN